MGDINSRKYVGKTIQLNYDAIRDQTEDRCLFCLNRQQQMALLAVIEPLGWLKRWYSPTDAPLDFDWIEDFYAQLAAELMTDHCDIDTAITNINTQLTTINTNITTINTDITTINTNITDVQNSLTIVQNNVTNVFNIVTPISLTLNLPDETFTSDSADVTEDETYARYNAFCKIVTNWMLSEAAAVMYKLGAPPSSINDVLLIIDSWALQSWANLFASGSTYTVVEIHDAFLDTTALNDVACAIITNLATLAPTYVNFKNMLFGYTPPAYPDHRAIIADTILNALVYLDGYNAFMALYTPAFQAMLAAGVSGYYCPPCTSPNFCSVPQSWNLAIGQKLPWLIQRGVYVEGQGIQGQAIPGDATTYGWDVSIIWPTGCSAVHGKGLKFTQAHLPSGALGNTHTLEQWSIPIGGGTPTKDNTASVGPNPTWPTPTQSARIALITPAAGRIMYKLRLYTNTAYYANATSSTVTASLLTALDLVV